VVLETPTTDTRATGQDDSHRSHERQPQDEIPEPRTTDGYCSHKQSTDTGATNDRHWSHKRQILEPQATTTGATSDKYWSHKRQPLEPQVTTDSGTGGTNERQPPGATGATSDSLDEPLRKPRTGTDTGDWSHKQQIQETGAMNDNRYCDWSHERQILEPQDETTDTATGATNDSATDTGATGRDDRRYWCHKRHERLEIQILPEP